MSTTIAIAGKGGVGKSTISALLIKWLNTRGIDSILAVDADANVNLNDLLGVEAGESIGAIREEMKEKADKLPGGMTKQQFFEYKINQCLVETANFDLISMGRPEGPGCYCYSNNLLRDILKTVADNYDYVVIDNEAGMEHLSRRTAQDIDYLLMVSDPSVRGIQTAGRLNRLLEELKTRVGARYLIINRVRGELSQEVVRQVEVEKLELLAVIMDDENAGQMDSRGEAVYGIDSESAIFKTIDNVGSSLFCVGDDA